MGPLPYNGFQKIMPSRGKYNYWCVITKMNVVIVRPCPTIMFSLIFHLLQNIEGLVAIRNISNNIYMMFRKQGSSDSVFLFYFCAQFLSCFFNGNLVFIMTFLLKKIIIEAKIEKYYDIICAFKSENQKERALHRCEFSRKSNFSANLINFEL